MAFYKDAAGALRVPDSMVAVRVNAYGDPLVMKVERIPVPEPHADEVLVKVRAAGVGPWDGWIRSGNSVLPQPLPLTLGSDIAGTVVVAGKSSGFNSGQRVYGVTNKRFTGGYAEYAACISNMVAEAPVILSAIEAASAPVVAVTALQMLFKHARLTTGQCVLVHGASGNVGRYAVQMARAANIHVIASASQAYAAELLALGAERVIDVRQQADIVVDAAIDLVGDSSQDLLYSFVRRGGSLISAVTTPSTELAEKHDIRGEFMLVDVNTTDLRAVAHMFDKGKILPLVGEVLGLDSAVHAHRMLEHSVPSPRGKIVLRVGSGEW